MNSTYIKTTPAESIRIETQIVHAQRRDARNIQRHAAGLHRIPAATCPTCKPADPVEVEA